jgi:hypothetical protein
MKGFLHSVMAVVAGLGMWGQIAVQQGAAQQIDTQQSTRSVVIHAGHMLDVKTGKLLSDQTLVIEDGKIVSIGDSAGAKAPTNALRAYPPDHGSQIRL